MKRRDIEECDNASTALTILVVDDDPDIRLLLRDRLDSAGFGIVEAADGQEAVDRATTPGLVGVLLDLDLPKRDGAAVLRWITQHVPQLPVVIMSAFTHKRKEMLASGAQAYFTKPLDLAPFTTVLASLFSARVGQVT